MLNFFQVSETSNGLDGIGVRTPLLYGTNIVWKKCNVTENSKKAVTSFQQGVYHTTVSWTWNTALHLYSMQ